MGKREREREREERRAGVRRVGGKPGKRRERPRETRQKLIGGWVDGPRR